MPDADAPTSMSFTFSRPDDAAAFQARDRLREMALGAGLGERASDLAVAVTELIANAFEHGRPPVSVSARWNGRMSVDVADAGRADGDPARWGRVPPATDATRGRGLWIVRQLMDDMHASSGPGGTVVTLAIGPGGEGGGELHA